MAVNQQLLARIRTQLARHSGVSEKRMFGGITFLVNGNMACGVNGETLMVRVGPEAYEAALELPHARECDFTGRPLRGLVLVDAPGHNDDDALAAWILLGHRFAATLPAK